MNFDEGHDGKPCCSFCGKREGQVKKTDFRSWCIYLR